MGREGEQGDARLFREEQPAARRGRYGDVGELFGGGVRDDSAIGEDE